MEKRLWIFLSVILAAMAVVGGYGWYAGAVPSFGFEWPGESSQVALDDVGPDAQIGFSTTTETTAVSSTVQANATVVKVVDGDTIDAKLDGEDKVYRIRLLGINTPETVDPRRPVECFGKQASDKMKEMASGKRVRLEADLQADERDKYDRLLRNVFLEDGTDVNAFMVREGFAYAYLSFPLDAKRKKELKKLEEDAKMAGRGLWAPEACSGNK